MDWVEELMCVFLCRNEIGTLGTLFCRAEVLVPDPRPEPKLICLLLVSRSSDRIGKDRLYRQNWLIGSEDRIGKMKIKKPIIRSDRLLSKYLKSL